MRELETYRNYILITYDDNIHDDDKDTNVKIAVNAHTCHKAAIIVADAIKGNLPLATFLIEVAQVLEILLKNQTTKN